MPRHLQGSRGRVQKEDGGGDESAQNSTCARTSVGCGRVDRVFQGSKIRASYIVFAQKEKKRLETLVADLEQDITLREKEVERLKSTHPCLRLL